MDDFQNFIAVSKYARFVDEKKRRETWPESVTRYLRFFVDKYPELLKGEILSELTHAIVGLEVMPSMRAITTAGQALEDHNVAGYNCAYTPIDHPKRLSEVMYILLCGTGVGFSVESRYVERLPMVPDRVYDTDTVIVVRDSKLGWAKAFKELISLLYSGHSPQWDLSRIRPSGARLRTFGGRASGPEPLNALFVFAVDTFRKAAGRRLTSLEVHDLVCKIGDIVVVGGVRRSALISLSDPSDGRMQLAKSGRWWEEHPYRSLANNSLCYNELPTINDFLEEWKSLYESRSGERGIFSRAAAKGHLERNVPRRDSGYDWGTNPCSEILLRPQQFCNLSEVVVRSGDSFESLAIKVKLATILGTLQSTLTDFKFLSKEWRDNCEEERLLGVSLTGIMDNEELAGNLGADYLEELLRNLKQVAIETNAEWAAALGINPSTAITCVKPSGTVSQLVDSASGIHPRFSKYYIRRVRQDIKDPLTQFLIDQGVPFEPDVTKPNDMAIFSFPIAAPDNAITADSMGAIAQLELWKTYAVHWCEHKPSITVYYSDDEFLDVGAWVYRNLDICSGIAFLPRSDHIYRQAPYEAITEQMYNKLHSEMPKVRWEEFVEEEDTRERVGEMACTSDKCEIVYD